MSEREEKRREEERKQITVSTSNMIPLKPYIQPATMCHPELNSLYTQLGSSCNEGM